MTYWEKRQIEQAEQQISKAYDGADRVLRKEYKRLANKTVADLKALLSEIALARLDGTILISDLYKAQRYFEILKELNKNLIALGETEVKILDKALLDLYHETFILNNEFSFVYTDDMARKCVDAIWCADGKHWSDRIWKNQALLQANLEQGLLDCVARGDKIDKIVNELRKDFGASYSNCKTLVNTELSNIYNQATLDRYKVAGITQYKILVADPCDDCASMASQVFDVNKAQVGVNYPPFHPNCKCTVEGII